MKPSLTTGPQLHSGKGEASGHWGLTFTDRGFSSTITPLAKASTRSSSSLRESDFQVWYRLFLVQLINPRYSNISNALFINQSPSFPQWISWLYYLLSPPFLLLIDFQFPSSLFSTVDLLEIFLPPWENFFFIEYSRQSTCSSATIIYRRNCLFIYYLVIPSRWKAIFQYAIDR